MPTFDDAEKLVKERITWFRKWTDDVPNYTHSFHVRDLLKKYWFDETVQMAWLLHDIVEDWDTTFDELRELWYPEEVITLVDLATHNMNIENPTDEQKFQRRKDMMKRLEEADNKDAWAVKLADITDNVRSCYTMPSWEKKARFMAVKCPYFLEKWKEIFWESDFYLNFTSSFVHALLRDIDYEKIWHWEGKEFMLSPSIHQDEKWDYIYVEWVVFRKFTGLDKYTWLWYAWCTVWWGHLAFYLWEWVEGKKYGYWFISYDDWDFYLWEFKDWVKEWSWQLNMPEVWEWYIWDFANDVMHWNGIYKFNNWDKYEWPRIWWKMEWVWRIAYENWDFFEWDFVKWEKNWGWLLIMKNWDKLYTKDGWINDIKHWLFLLDTKDWKKYWCIFENWEMTTKKDLN